MSVGAILRSTESIGYAMLNRRAGICPAPSRPVVVVVVVVAAKTNGSERSVQPGDWELLPSKVGPHASSSVSPSHTTVGRPLAMLGFPLVASPPPPLCQCRGAIAPIRQRLVDAATLAAPAQRTSSSAPRPLPQTGSPVCAQAVHALARALQEGASAVVS